MAGVSPVSVYSVTSLPSPDVLRSARLPWLQDKCLIPSSIHFLLRHLQKPQLPLVIVLPVPDLARMSSRRVCLRNAVVLSPARVKDDNHVFWECHCRHDYSLRRLLPGCLVGLLPGSRRWLFGDRHRFPSTLHRAVRLHR